MILRELITKLAFTHDGRGLKQSQNALGSHSKSMARTVGRLGSQMSGSMGKAFNSIAIAGGKAFSGLESRFTKMKSAISKGVTATFKFHGLDKAQSKVSSLHKKVLAMAAGAAGGVGVGAAGKFVFDTGRSFEDILAGLHGATGSQQAAESEFTRLQDFTKKTTFGVKELATAYIRLKNLDLDASERTMMAYGNIASSIPGKTMMDFTEAVADAVTGEMERLKEFGMKTSQRDGNVSIRFRGQMFNIAAGKDGQIDEKGVERQLVEIAEKFFAGSMERKSQTVGGAVNKLVNAVQIGAWKLWRAGIDKPIASAIRNITSWVEKVTPKLQEMGKAVGEFMKSDLPGYLEKMKKILPYVGFGLGVMYTHMLGLKTMQFAWMLYKGAAALRAMGVAGAFANAAMGFIPIIIGAGVLLFADFIYWLNTGESHLLSFTEQWPWLHAAISDVYDFSKEFLRALGEGFQNASEYWVPKLLTGWGDLSQGMKDLEQNTINMWNLIKEIWDAGVKRNQDFGQSLINTKNLASELWTGLVTWINDAGVALDNFLRKIPGVGALADFVDRTVGGGAGNGLSPANMSGKANPVSENLVKNARSVKEVARYCLRAVAKMHAITYGTAQHLATDRAYKAADIIAKSDKFVEVKLNKAMLDNPEYQAMLHGATVIYPRGNGFSAESGHAEVFDMVSKTAHYGRGADPLSRRSDSQLRGARAFLPVQNVQNVAAPSPVRPTTGGNNAQIQQTINVNGPGNAQTIAQAARDGAKLAISNAGLALVP